MPQATRMHLEKPALPSRLHESIDAFERRISRLETEVAEQGSNATYPEWWYQETSTLAVVQEQMQDPHAAPENVSRLFQLHRREQRVHAVIAGKELEPASIGWICDQLGLEVVARGFKAEAPDGPMHRVVLEGLAPRVKGYYIPTTELTLLGKVYATENITQLLGVQDIAYAALRPLLRGENAIRTMRFVDEAKGSTLSETWACSQEWMSRALAAATGIEEDEAATYTFAAARQGTDKSFADILRRFDHFGIDRLRTINTFTEIAAFEEYSLGQLERMEALCSDPEAAAAQLAERDVTVVMTNRTGDRGTLVGIADDYEDDSGAVLFFEFSSAVGVLRHMIKLNKLGIKPSTMVLAAHNAPGQFIISDERDPVHTRKDFITIAGRALVAFVNENGVLGEDSFGYSMHGMKGVARMVEEYMQPSRASNDADENMGRKKIIFHACDAGTEVDAMDIDDQGRKTSTGLESVVSRIGKDLAANSIHSSVDIYGAPSGIRVSRSTRGVRYTARPASLDDTRRRPQHAVRFRVENGHLSKQDVNDIPMR